MLCSCFASCYNARMKSHTATIALCAILISSACFAWVRDGHRHIARAPDRETAVVHLGMLIGYPFDEQIVPRARASAEHG